MINFSLASAVELIEPRFCQAAADSVVGHAVAAIAVVDEVEEVSEVDVVDMIRVPLNT